MERKPHAGDLRNGRASEPGRIYLITTVTHGRAPIFKAFSAARSLILVLREAERRSHAKTLAFVVMPDHLHWLMELGDQQELSRVVAAVKSVSARHLGGGVWQAGFHDHALRREEDIIGVARYVVANPMRAGLADRVGDYPHWDAAWL
ncbi:MAG: transposase [Candidatus Sedimenticola sp. (ex Thyasira tokunagai)]